MTDRPIFAFGLTLPIFLVLSGCAEPENFLLYCEGDRGGYMYFQVDLRNQQIFNPDDPDYKYKITRITDTEIVGLRRPPGGFFDEYDPRIELDRRTLDLNLRVGGDAVRFNCRRAPDRQL